MPTIQETAYPRLKSVVSARDVASIYTPTPNELALAEQSTRGEGSHLSFLILLKTFQRLGYFPLLSQLPPAIVEHITILTQTQAALPELAGYDLSGTRKRHLQIIRQALHIQIFGRAARHAMLLAMREAARTKEDLADLINVSIEVSIEELVRKKYELPAFDTLVRAARHIRAVLYRDFYRHVEATLTPEEQACIDALFVAEPDTRFTPWNTLKQEPGSPTLTHLKLWLDRQIWLAQYRIGAKALEGIPDVKVKHFAAEARTLDAARMLEMELRKRRTLAASLLRVQSARVLDDLAEMLIKRLSSLHQKGKDALAEYHLRNQQRADELVQTLQSLVTAYRSDGNALEKIAAMDVLLPDKGDAVLQRCEEHMAHAGDNYYPFLWRFFKSHRATLFRLLQALEVKAMTQATAFVQALRFLRENEPKTGEWVPFPKLTEERTPGLDLSWMSEAWWRLVTQQHNRDVVAYGEMVGLPIDADGFVARMKARLTQAAEATDRAFPENAALRIENGEPVLRRPEKAPILPGLRALEIEIAERLEQIHLLNILRDTQYWLNWSRFFGPLSGHDAKLEDPVSRYLATVFCFGCHLGPVQAVRSLGNIDPRQLSWVHWRHISEEALDKAIREVINTYHKFALPRRWGTGKSASVDGTQWDLYEQNLLAERHIRYGGYGGIGYYHVSDTYIALFANFIPCGVWEAICLLDGLLNNLSDIQPDTIHGDTQAQSTPVFGLGALLGITLMPRIRHWKDLKLYRPDRKMTFTHIGSLFSDTIDWDLIKTHLPDMLRVALSIKAGRITPSTLLRKLGTYSKKNRLYQAFRELGCVLRTEFLLKYLDSAELRSLIQAATNKSESFNGFAQWAAFGGDGTILSNDRDEQRKIIKYNHLVANCVIFHNVFSISQVLHTLQNERYPLGAEEVASLSPYLRPHINLFGHFPLDMETVPPELVYDLWTGA